MLLFAENKEGIRWHNPEHSYVSFDKAGQLPDQCGEVVGYKRVNSISDGPLTLTIQCLPQSIHSEVVPAARIEPYRFQIEELELKKGESEPLLRELLDCAI